MKCYAILGKDSEGKEIRCSKEQDDAFCSEEHHQIWIKANPKTKQLNEDGKPKRTIAEMQQRLREMAEEARQKKRKTLFD